MEYKRGYKKKKGIKRKEMSKPNFSLYYGGTIVLGFLFACFTATDVFFFSFLKWERFDLSLCLMLITGIGIVIPYVLIPYHYFRKDFS